jgi:hypothetical protein
VGYFNSTRQRVTSHDHLAERCRDDWCQRLPCRLYKDGYERGYEDGQGAGYASGYAAGYSAGYSASAGSGSG